jgi:hypothetical protein
VQHIGSTVGQGTLIGLCQIAVALVNPAVQSHFVASGSDALHIVWVQQGRDAWDIKTGWNGVTVEHF